jgi:hypothetical protein
MESAFCFMENGSQYSCFCWKNAKGKKAHFILDLMIATHNFSGGDYPFHFWSNIFLGYLLSKRVPIIFLVGNDQKKIMKEKGFL